jgi:hypothetical protein
MKDPHLEQTLIRRRVTAVAAGSNVALDVGERGFAATVSVSRKHAVAAAVIAEGVVVQLMTMVETVCVGVAAAGTFAFVAAETAVDVVSFA